ncbi:hypothetical protein DPMN_087913 [Dreissena polymorpha]|uniref:HAT C-terminal dimerisation domain-containing protein n=1 Tax=Dreissena polymorpha TaxID=45954 RepID=A0A9D4KTJ8_DREPO|nr:hypothetical protein DPMN_087913 [Dreissena polymorpha]
MHGHSQASTAFKFLASKLPNVITPEEEGQLNMELNAFSVDRQVKDLSEAEQKKVDTDFWAKVFCLKTFSEQRYPTLSKLAQSLLSIFSGPLVEGTFNIMGDIIEEDRAKMCIENYEAVAIVKTAMKSSNVNASTLKVTNAMKMNCIKAYSNYQKFLKQTKVEIEDKKKIILSESIGKLKLEKAKRLAKLTRLKNRIVNKVARQKETRKRAAEESISKLPSTSNKWKRIKTI